MAEKNDPPSKGKGKSSRIGKNIAGDDAQIITKGSGNTFTLEFEGDFEDGPDIALDHGSCRAKIITTGDKNQNKIKVKKIKSEVSVANPQSQAVPDQEKGSETAQTFGKTISGSEDLVTVEIRSLAKRKKIDHSFKTTDLVSVVKAVVKDELNESGEFHLFKEGRKLTENKTLAENGIKTDDKIIAGVEEVVQSGSAGQKVKA